MLGYIINEQQTRSCCSSGRGLGGGKGGRLFFSFLSDTASLLLVIYRSDAEEALEGAETGVSRRR